MASNTWGMTSDRGADWRDKAACRGVDPEMFFPVGINTADDSETDAAKTFCRKLCPDMVRAECLALALAFGADDGVWGGTTPAERRGMHLAHAVRADVRCSNGHPGAGNLRFDRRGGRYCVACRRDQAATVNGAAKRKKVLAEQFPDVAELVQELPGVADRPRHAGRPVMSR